MRYPNRLLVLVLLTAVGFLQPLPPQAREARNNDLFNREEAQKDLRYLVRLLRNIHPNLYAHRSPRDLKRRFNSVIDDIGSRETRWDLLIRAQTILSAVCDEHTGVSLSRENSDIYGRFDKWFGDPLIVSGDDLLVENGTDELKAPKVKAINGRKAEDLRNLLLDLVQTDGCIQNETALLRHHPDVLVYLTPALGKVAKHFLVQLDTGDTSKTTFRKSVPRSHRWASGLYRSHTRFGRETILSRFGIASSPLDFTSHRYFQGIWERSTADGRVAYIRSFHFEGGKLQERAVDTIMRRIIKSKPDHVILDLTENPGGEIRRASQLLSYFLPRSHLIASRVYRRGAEPSPTRISPTFRRSGRNTTSAMSGSTAERARAKAATRFVCAAPHLAIRTIAAS